ncbi:MAG: patatin-like phospholipase family protein [bacterium]|nr:patatin-like phospholipase family protein [bacterium]
MSATPVIGLALGSGGARGLAHAGVLQALEEAGLPPARIAGTSMGAIVGGLYAETLDAAESWRRLARFVQDPEFLETWAPFVPKGSGPEEETGRFHELVDALHKKYLAVKTVTRPCLVDESRLRHPLAQMFHARDFARLGLPFAAVGLDLVAGERVVFREGDLLDAVYASAAVPGVFPPLARGGRLIVDGGAPYRVPIETCRDLGAELVIAVDIPSFEPAKVEYRTGMDVILRSDAVARQRLDALVIRTADLVISPDVAAYHWSDFRRAEDCRRCGYEAARAALPTLRRLIDERGNWLARVRNLFAKAPA